jgi:DNA-binding response OmpR family regulator
MPKSVLLVEDEDSIALALGFLMEREGYELRRVANGTDALAAIRERAPDLVLLDVMLPGANGYEICQQIRLDPSLARTRILMMTAKGGEIERRKGLALGADAFVAKPFSTAELKSTVRRLLEEAA